VLERRRGPGEADLAAVAAPDGTSIFFCSSAAAWQTDSWLSDFEPAQATSARHATGIDRIDHIALAQPFDLFDQAALFYRSVLGLEPLDSVELAAPAGVRPLPIPANHYDALSARYDLDPDLAQALRELDVLYERSGDTEFLHFYTATVDGRLFFEVVQRRRGYAGYGAANAPVRTAAQRAAASG
jgi:4-hydroxyphenylpyruvate dioxygenase